MKKNKLQILIQAFMLLGFISLVALSSCKKDDKDDPKPADPIASFQFAVDETDFLKVTFTNFSQNATSYSWNFGDGNTSTETNPVHTYAAPGNFTVVLTATNQANISANFSQVIEVKDPDEALTLLAGQTSKTWKLYRVGTSMGVGPSPEEPRIWWSLLNDGSRPCVYYHEVTFHRNGVYQFDDKGSFWGEGGLFPAGLEGTCFEAIPSNMVNVDGVDVSAWLGGTHAFEYVPTTSMITLTGTGAWIGLPKVGTDGEVTVPQNSVRFRATLEQHEGFDLMIVLFAYDWGVWEFSYASYSNPALEPEVVEESAPWGEDLPDITPTVLYHTFESAESFELLGAIGGTSVITVGEDDPEAGETKVGKFVRVGGEQWQEAQLRTTPDLYDIQFDNFTKVKIDIYVPANTVFADGGLVRQFVFGFADQSQTQEWWNSPVQFLVAGEDFVVGTWTTYEFDLTDVKARNDLDMIYLGIGGGGHVAEGIFYVRNLIFD
jgi:PKD repeat protein